MIPNFFIDLTGGYQPALASDMLRKLHGIFTKQPNTYALLIDEHKPFSGFRIFAEHLTELNAIIEFFNNSAFAKKQYSLGYANQVPADYSGPGVMLLRVKMSGKQLQKDDPNRYAAQLERSEDLPYFILNSKQNGQRFSLKVRHAYGDYTPKHNDANPDSYGLSRAQNQITLPLLES